MARQTTSIALARSAAPGAATVALRLTAPWAAGRTGRTTGIATADATPALVR